MACGWPIRISSPIQCVLNADYDMTLRLKYFLMFVTAAILLTAVTACNDSDEPSRIPGPAGSTDNSPVERAVLVYLLADNSLGSGGFDRRNLADMIQACRDGAFTGNRLIVYHDDNNVENPMLKEVTPLGLKILKEYSTAPLSVARERMEEVIRDFKQIAPAERYGLILWSHATGWLINGENATPSSVTPLWFGEDRQHYMNIPVLADVLEEKGFDYIYFDCCHMASVEALYELRKVADMFVGSCAELPAEGMPYRATLPFLMRKEPDLVAAAKATFNKYDALEGRARTATMSVIDATRLEQLAEATHNFYATGPVLDSGYTGQPFERPKYGGEPCYLFDYQDYIDALYFNNRDIPEVRTAYASILEAMDECVIYQASTPYIFNTVSIDAHSGLTTFILRAPEDADIKGYRTLAWYRDVASFLF